MLLLNILELVAKCDQNKQKLQIVFKELHSEVNPELKIYLFKSNFEISRKMKLKFHKFQIKKGLKYKKIVENGIKWWINICGKN